MIENTSQNNYIIIFLYRNNFPGKCLLLEKSKTTLNTSYMSQNKTILKFKPHYFRRAIYFKQVAIFFPSPSPQISEAVHLSQFSSRLFFQNQLQSLKQSSISNGNLHILLFKLLFQTLNKSGCRVSNDTKQWRTFRKCSEPQFSSHPFFLPLLRVFFFLQNFNKCSFKRNRCFYSPATEFGKFAR